MIVLCVLTDHVCCIVVMKGMILIDNDKLWAIFFFFGNS